MTGACCRAPMVRAAGSRYVHVAASVANYRLHVQARHDAAASVLSRTYGLPLVYSLGGLDVVCDLSLQR